MAWSLFVLCSVSLAQQPDVQYPQNAIDSRMRREAHVDPASLALGFQIDLGTYRGRAGASLPVTLYYSSKLWRVKHVDVTPRPPCGGKWTNCEQDSNYDALYAEKSASGWTSSLDWFQWGSPEPLQLYTLLGKPCGDTQPCPNTVARVFVGMPDGSRHEMRREETSTSAVGFNPNGTYYSVDGAQMKYDYATATLKLPDGSRYIFSSPQQYIDRNGNKLTYDDTNRRWTDTLGRFIPLPPLNNSTPGDLTYSLAGVNGSTVTYTFKWRYLTDVRSNPDNQTNPLRYKGDKTLAYPYQPISGPSLFHSWDEYNSICVPASLPLFNPVVLYQIVLPNQTTYSFTYDVYGEIDKVVYPTGAYEKFTYGEVAELSGNLSSVLGNQYSQANRGVTSRKVSFSGSSTDEVTWTYQASSSTRTIIAPDLSRTETVYHTSKGSLVVYGFDDARVGHAYEERVYAASGQMIRRKLTEWTYDSNSTVTRNARVLREVEILLDSTTGALAKSTTYDYDAYLNVTEVEQYAFVPLDLTSAQTAAISSIGLGTQMRTQRTQYVTAQAYLDRNMISLPESAQTLAADGVSVVSKSWMFYDEYALLSNGSVIGWTDPATTARGNLTTAQRFLSDSTTSAASPEPLGPGVRLETHTQYDNCGSPRYIWDAKGNQSQIEYSQTFQFAYPTHTISPTPTGGSALETSTGYDPATGVVTSSTDANGQVTSFYYVDSLNRLTRVERPGGGWTNYFYGDTVGNLYLRTQTSLDATRSLDAYQYFDGLGRAVRSFASEGANAWIISDTQYDNMGRVWRVSNPYRSSSLTGAINPSGEWTTTTYDALARVRTLTTPDNAVVNTEYSLNQVTVTDQATKSRRSVTDALGRLVQVIEDPFGSLAYQTDYAYDTLGNLTSVTQGTQPARTFEYDTLSRLKTARNPESGTISYTYDENSNLSTKTDARGVITTYTYDKLNRVTIRSYTLPTLPPGMEVGATPTVTYGYDAVSVPFSKGRLTSVSSSVSSYAYGSYDAMGRVLTGTQTTDSQAYPMSYAYDLAGNMTSETYPSGRIVQTDYDSAGRIATVKRQSTEMSYASLFQYAANGAVQAMQMGNGRWERTIFNNRLQPTQIKLDSNTSGSNTLQLDYGYGTTTNNGNVISQTITVPNPSGGNLVLTQNYGYDALNRLSTANENSGTSWTQTYDIDRWGNRAVRSTSTYIPTPLLTPQSANSTDFSAFNQNNNRIVRSGFEYDSAGNLTGDPTTTANAIVYDGENRQTSYTKAGTTASYSYDGDGRRVKKVSAGVTTILVYNVTGQLIAEYTSGTPAAGDTSYLTTDHLGST